MKKKKIFPCFSFLFLFLAFSFFYPFSSFAIRRGAWEFFHPHPSLFGTGGLLRVVSPRTLSLRNFSIGTYIGLFDTPNDEVIVISREYFALREQRERILFEQFNSFGVFSYVFVGAGGPSFDVGGIISSDISLAWRASSWLVRNQMRNREPRADNVQSIGDIFITPKVAYTLESGEGTGALWAKFSFLSSYRRPELGAVSISPGISLMYDADENKSILETLRQIELINPRVYLSVSFTFDNSKDITQGRNIPSYIETAMFIEPFNYLNFGLGLELGDARRGIGKFISWFFEWSFMQYIPPPEGTSFGDMPVFLSTGLRVRPIPIIASVVEGIFREIKDLTLFIAGDFNVSRVHRVEFEIGPPVFLRNAPSWKVLFGLSLFWNPWRVREGVLPEKGGKIKGIVVDSETGSPLGDVIVSYTGFPLTPQATNPGTGEFTSYELPPGEVEIVLRKPGYEVKTVKVNIEQGKLKEINISLEKKKDLGAITGMVRDTEGKPLAARLEVEGVNMPPAFSNPTDGEYEIILQPGSYKVNVYSEGYNPTSFEVKISAGEKKRMDIVMEPIQEVIQKVSPEGQERLKEAEKKIVVEKGTNRIILPEKILFEPEGVEVIEGSIKTIRELAEFLKNNIPDKKIRIEVHTSPLKDKDFDRDITQKRAERIVDLLVEFGVPRERLIPVGKGSDYPIASNDTPEGRAINRRVEIFIEGDTQQ